MSHVSGRANDSTSHTVKCLSWANPLHEHVARYRVIGRVLVTWLRRFDWHFSVSLSLNQSGTVSMSKWHHYLLKVVWTGNQGKGTTGYRAYSRDHTIVVEGKTDILGSSDPSFRGDPTRHNPEELFVASLSGCHMLWVLHLCSVAGIVVETYEDQAEGKMEERPDGAGRFTEVILRPHLSVRSEVSTEAMDKIHDQAHKNCFIANSCNFPVRHIASHQLITGSTA